MNWRQHIVETRKKTREEIMEYGRTHNPTWDEIDFPLGRTAKN
tara:strand:+ start:4066 stop:4194 length:129 start_codon:yes stop_codon:yes gene_type:complete